MSDAGDAAQAYAAAANATSAQHRKPTAPRAAESADCCEECGALIPGERQNAVPGCTMCAECAGWWERRNG